MRQEVLLGILGVCSALFGGLNVFQFLFIRSTRRRYRAEAELASTEAEQRKVDLMQDQYDYVLGQLTKIQNEYYEMAARYRETLLGYSREIGEKCNEIAELKSRLSYFRGLRCYRADCSERIGEVATGDGNGKGA